MNALYGSQDHQRRSTIRQRRTTGLEPYRSPYRRDHARLIHSAAFRRLQGKTQVFPGEESDFFRNRLTHSLEVAQIAKSIAIRLNNTHQYFQDNPIDIDLVELAGLAHDLGHPPFGHNGESALDECMRSAGGFEGNAQTFHILTKIEKKDVLSGFPLPIDEHGVDKRLGLNWCFRSLAGVIKYDRIIPDYREPSTPLVKGIYGCDRYIFEAVKKGIYGTAETYGEFRTIEASIMDLADDIAYATYDLEDILKVGLLAPLDILSCEEQVLHKVANKVGKALSRKFMARDVLDVLLDVFRGLYSDPVPKAPNKVSAKEQLFNAAQCALASKQPCV